MTHAIAYLRTSSASNVAGDSEQRQRLAIEGYAKAHGIQVVGEFYDAAVSGADPVETRPGFAAMLERIAGNGVRLVLCEDASRFARSMLAQELGVLAMQKLGVVVLTASGENLTETSDPSRVMMRQVAGAFSQYEKTRLVLKLRAARDRKSAIAGRRIEGKKGYAGHRPEVIAALRDIKAARADATLAVLAEELATRGFTTSTGKTFAPNQVRRLLAKMRTT
jgi:DNA invertase Pin-like site-specific DNA recombinase